MIVIKRKLKNKDLTGSEMYKMIDRTYRDLLFPVRYKNKIRVLGKMSMIEFFDYIKNIPYRIDPKPREILIRPKYALKNKNLGMDCKKKAVLVGSYAKLNNIPYRILAVSGRSDKKLHHTYPEFYLGSRWVGMDATYNTYYPGMQKKYTRKEILKRN